MPVNPRQFSESDVAAAGGVLRPTAAPTWAESLQRVLTAGLILGCVGVIAACLPDARSPSAGEGVASAEFDSNAVKRRRVAMARLHEQRMLRASR